MIFDIRLTNVYGLEMIQVPVPPFSPKDYIELARFRRWPMFRPMQSC